MEEGLPEDLETLVAMAKLIGVTPNIVMWSEQHGLPKDGEMRWMAVKSIQDAIKHKLHLQEVQNRWQSS